MGQPIPLAPARPRHRAPALAAAVAALLACGCASVPVPRLPADCDAALVGVPREELEQFVVTVEAGLARKDWAGLARLVRCPLRVNAGGWQGAPVSRLQVAERDEFLRRAPRLFVAVGDRGPAAGTPSAPRCVTGMVGMAGGRVWATAFQEGLAITSVNCRGCAESEERQAVELDCVADGLRYVLRPLDGARWLEVSSPSDPADGVATGRVVEEGEGTGGCAQLVWSAVVGGLRLVVREAAGCVDEEPVPGTVAFVGVEGAGSAVACVASPR